MAPDALSRVRGFFDANPHPADQGSLDRQRITVRLRSLHNRFLFMDDRVELFAVLYDQIGVR